MNRPSSAIVSVLLVCLLCGCCFGCAPQKGEEEPSPSAAVPSDGADAAATPLEEIDYAVAVQPDAEGETLKEAVTVKGFVDGDTTHFFVPTDVVSSGVLKARYLAVNTPEITGKVEEYGKAAAAYTRERLSEATSILIESDDGRWNLDSTGERYLVWVWYRTDNAEPYRNLNIELLQNGLGIASSSANNRYGDTCMAAIEQAKAFGRNIYSGEPDPDFYYGDAVELTLKELRLNAAAYDGVKVAFEGVVTMNGFNCVYVEDFDEETERYYGILVYYGYSLSGGGLDALTVGNLTRVVGTMQYYEAGDTYQVAGVSYRQMRPDDPDNLQKIGEGYAPAYAPMTADEFVNGRVVLDTEGDRSEYAVAELALHTSVSMEGLLVQQVSGGSETDGEATLLCESEGVSVTIRLESGASDLLEEETLEGRTIDVRGIVDCFGGNYQILVFSKEGMTIY